MGKAIWLCRDIRVNIGLSRLRHPKAHFRAVLIRHVDKHTSIETGPFRHFAIQSHDADLVPDEQRAVVDDSSPMATLADGVTRGTFLTELRLAG